MHSSSDCLVKNNLVTIFNVSEPRIVYLSHSNDPAMDNNSDSSRQRRLLRGSKTESKTGFPLHDVETYTVGGSLGFGCRSSQKLLFPHTSPPTAADSSHPRARDDVKPSRLHAPLLLRVLVAKFEGRRCDVS